MSTVFFTALTCLTISELAVALNLPLGQDATEPLNYLAPTNQLPSYSPALNNDNKLADLNLQALEQSPNSCPNLEILQNILDLLKRLVEQGSETQNLQPDKKIQLLTNLKKQIERSGPINNINDIDIQPIQKENQVLLLNGTTNRALYQHINDNANNDPKIEAQLLLKYTLPATPSPGCKEVLAALIQAINTAHSQLENFCEQSGKCNVGDVNSNLQLNDLPRILNDVSSSQPQVPQQQTQPAKLIDMFGAQRPLQPPNTVYNAATQKELYNNYLRRLIQMYNKQEKIDNVLNNIKDKTKIYQNLLKLQQNKAETLDSANKLSYDALIKLHQVLKDRSASVASNQLNTLNNNFLHPVQNYIPGNLLQSNPNTLGNLDLNAGYTYNLPQSDKTKQLINPNLNIQGGKDLSSFLNPNNLNLNSNEAKTIGNLIQPNPIVRLNPYEQQYFTDYLNHEIRGNTLVNSQRESVSNLLKLNSAIDNGVVELTYKLKHPQSVVKNYDNAYYYVKYRMPYQTFMSKVVEALRNPQLRSDPAKLYEDLLSDSNLVELSHDLKDIGNNDPSKVTNNGATLISAKVLSTNSPLDDEYIKTLQKLNANLNTNDIVNFVNNENINKGPSNAMSGLNEANLQNANLLAQNLDEQSVQIVSPVQTSVTNDNTRKAFIKTMNIVPGTSPSAVNPRVMYNTLLNTQSFSPFTFQASQPPKYALG